VDSGLGNLGRDLEREFQKREFQALEGGMK
jgi:hypothetical protein